MRTYLEIQLISSITIILTLLFLLSCGVFTLFPQSCKEVLCAPGLAAQSPQWPSLFLAPAVVIYYHSPQLGHVPELEALVVATAGQEVAAVGEGQLLHGLPSMLAHTAHHTIRQDIDSPGQGEKSVGSWLVESAPRVISGLSWLLSPDDSISGTRAQQALSDWNHAVNRLCS